MSGRTDLAAALRAGLAGWRVVDTYRPLDSITASTVALWTANVDRLEYNGTDWLRATVETWILTPVEKADLVEDSLDDLLTQVLAVIEANPAFTWSTAERATLAETFPGWKLPITCLYQIGT